jgi:hypothetical protein
MAPQADDLARRLVPSGIRKGERTMRFTRLKTIGVALVAVAALSAIAASFSSAADAPRWKVGGAFLASGKTEALTGATTEVAWLNSPKLNLQLTNPAGKCTLVESKIIGSGENVAGTATGKLLCTEVKVHNAAACSVHSPGKPNGTVETNLLLGHLVWLAATGDKAGITFIPDPPATLFVTIIIEGCGAAGEYPIAKGIIGAIDPEAAEVTTGTLTFPSNPSSTTCNSPILTDWDNSTPRNSTAHTQLTLLAQPAAFCTAFSIHLTSDKNWGVFTG